MLKCPLFTLLSAFLVWITLAAAQPLQLNATEANTLLQQWQRSVSSRADDPCPGVLLNVHGVDSNGNEQAHQLSTAQAVEHMQKLPRGHYIRVDILLSQPCRAFSKNMTLVLRSGSTDTSVFRMMFVEYEFELLLTKLLAARPPARILDLGGNCGLASVFFSSMFPNAKVVAVEPALHNFNVLRLNTAFNKNIFAEQASISDANAYHHIRHSQGEWAVFVGPVKSLWTSARGHTFPSLTVDHILEKYGWTDGVDFVKVDVEGGERQLCGHIQAGASWIKSVRCLSMETHDRYMSDGFKVEAFCSDVLKEAGFTWQFTLPIDAVHVWCRE